MVDGSTWKILWDVIWYIENDGTIPVREFLSNLDPAIRPRFVASIDVLSEDSITGQTVAEYLESQLWELREEKDTCRLIFSYIVGQRVVLLHGFLQQNRQTTSQSEIKIALKRLEHVI